VIKKKPGMLQAAREIIGEKGITVNFDKEQPRAIRKR
jgi:hypothetical protein